VGLLRLVKLPPAIATLVEWRVKSDGAASITVTLLLVRTFD